MIWYKYKILIRSCKTSIVSLTLKVCDGFISEKNQYPRRRARESKWDYVLEKTWVYKAWK